MTFSYKTRCSWPTKTLIGRTTFVNTLCNRKVLEGKDADDAANAHIEEGVKIKPVTVGMWGRNSSQGKGCKADKLY